METNNNPLNLIVGKQYAIRHLPSNSNWKIGSITRITDAGYPWFESFLGDVQKGILCCEYYQIVELPDMPKVYTEKEVKNLTEMAYNFGRHSIINQEINTTYDDWWGEATKS